MITMQEFIDVILPKVTYHDAEITCYRMESLHGRYVLKVRRPVKDAYNPSRMAMQQFTEIIWLDHFYNEYEAVKFVFDTILKMEQHEAAEWFHYAGVRTFDPHATQRWNGSGDDSRLPDASLRGVAQLAVAPPLSYPIVGGVGRPGYLRSGPTSGTDEGGHGAGEG